MVAQDMPPPGGFASIPIEKTYPKALIRQKWLAAAMVAMTFYGYHYIREWKKRHRVLKIEQAESYVAVTPFLIAEQERKFLSYLHYLREEERELMKDHPGWKLGTLYGEPVFKTIPEGSLPSIHPYDWIAHRSLSEWQNHVVTPDNHQ